tara:strand:+ start:277 stop:831 length:555 start_codon:yes stop_codon:yes gene_type:complete
MEFTSFEETIGVYDADPEVVKSCLDYVYELQKEEPQSDGHSNYGGWQKNFDFPPIKRLIEIEFKKYISHHKIKEPYWYSFTKLFCNINPPGAYNNVHHHTVGEFSGVLWLKALGNAGDLVVMNPYPNKMLNTCTIADQDYNAMYFKPTANKGIFMNSNLIHYVSPNRTVLDRVSVGYHIGVHYQ